MEGVRILACNSSLQASLSSRRAYAEVSSIARRSSLIAFQGVHGWKERSRLVFGGRKERRRGLAVVRIRSSADECCGESSAEREEDSVANRSFLRNEPRTTQGVDWNDFLAVNWARLQVMGWLTLVAFGIGASAASASVSRIKPSRRHNPPCFASIASDKGQDSRGKGTTTASEDSTKQQGDSQEQPIDTKGVQDNGSCVDVKKVEIIRQESEEDDHAEGEYEDAEESDADADIGSDDEGTNYPTIGDLEDLDELGELASGAAAAELLSGSGEIESAEAEGDRGLSGDTEDEDLKKAFEEWKSKPYALTVPLRIVGLRGSVPPAWLKEFLMSQGRNAKLSAEFKGSLSDILVDLAVSMEQDQVTPRSTMAADLVTIGDSWLVAAVQGGLIEPIRNAEEFDWFNRLHPKWQNFLRRNVEGVVDPAGSVWGIPYRWGSLVFAFRKDKLEKNGIAPIKDWKDLFQPQLAGRVAMVDNPREVVGAVLKSLGASYNTSDFDAQVPGGRDAVKERFVALQKQVRLFDDNDYLKAMGAGDVWVAVGWSSDIIPYSKRASNISVFAPESGTSLWADLWAIPATTAFEKQENLGGRVRGPSPLVFQWLDFCLQPARAATFANDVFVGASPLAWSEKMVPAEKPAENSEEIGNSTQKESESAIKMDTNIVEGVPPGEVVAKSEFLEPLSDQGVVDYQWLLSTPVEAVGWPGSFAEFVKGLAASFRFRNPQGSRS